MEGEQHVWRDEKLKHTENRKTIQMEMLQWKDTVSEMKNAVPLNLKNNHHTWQERKKNKEKSQEK